MEREDIEWSWLETTGRNDPERLEKEVGRFQPDTLVAAGGDGTVHLVAQLAVPGNLRVGILPLGSANGLARELELPDDPMEALSVVVRGKTGTLDVLKINNTLCIHLCDIGLNATVVKRFDKAGYRGILGYFMQYIKEIGKVSSKKFILEEEGRERELGAVMVIATHTRYLGTGAIINPGGDPNDGLFEVCIIRKFPLWMVLNIAIAMFTGSIDRLRFVTIRSYRNLEVENLSGADFQVDGEVYPATRHIRMSTNDRPMRVIIPEERSRNDGSL